MTKQSPISQLRRKHKPHCPFSAMCTFIEREWKLVTTVSSSPHCAIHYNLCPFYVHSLPCIYYSTKNCCNNYSNKKCCLYMMSSVIGLTVDNRWASVKGFYLLLYSIFIYLKSTCPIPLKSTCPLPLKSTFTLPLKSTCPRDVFYHTMWGRRDVDSFSFPLFVVSNEIDWNGRRQDKHIVLIVYLLFDLYHSYAEYKKHILVQKKTSDNYLYMQ